MERDGSATVLRASLAALLAVCGIGAVRLISHVKLTALEMSALPPGEESIDIGPRAIPAVASYSGGLYTIRASNGDIWDVTDGFHYVYQPVSGDVEIVARVRSLNGSNERSMAGVMIRESLTAQSRHATAATSIAKGYTFVRRPSAGGPSQNTGATVAAPFWWVRLVRSGDVFTAYRSTDGVSWSRIGKDTLPMNDTVYVGLAVASHNNDTPITAVIDSVKVTSASLANRNPAVSITAPAIGTSFAASTNVTIAAIASDPESRMLSVDFYVDSTLIERDTAPPYAVNWTAMAGGTHTLTAIAHDADGGSSISAAVDVMVFEPANQPASVSLTTNAASFSAPASIGMTALASDPEGSISHVEFYAGTSLLGSVATAPYAFVWSDVPAGNYALKAVVVDGQGARSWSAPVTVAVQPSSGNQPPLVSLSTGGLLSLPLGGTLTLMATASDPEGQLSRVEFFAGATRLSTATSAPYSFDWSGTAQGVYAFTAVAYDSAGASAASSAIAVTVGASAPASPPRLVVFQASTDHATTLVTNYLLMIFAAGANPATAPAIATSDLGKPQPAANGDISVDRSAFFTALGPGNYQAIVTSIGPTGQTHSAGLMFTR